MKNRNLDHKDNWATPPVFLEKLEGEFGEMFDPCPLTWDEITPETDGLLMKWKQVNYINPPYSQKLKEAFVLKAIEESKQGKICVMLLPVSTSTKLFHNHIKPNAHEIRFIKGRIPFIGINNKGEYVNWHQWGIKPPEGAKQVKNSGQHDSMIVIFK